MLTMSWMVALLLASPSSSSKTIVSHGGKTFDIETINTRKSAPITKRECKEKQDWLTEVICSGGATSQCLANERVLYGPVRRVKGVLNPASCQKKCQESPFCTNWSWYGGRRIRVSPDSINCFWQMRNYKKHWNYYVLAKIL
eukprot:TRINITY_DN31606_c0_g1_i1.p1 TRINITY_DN31606_c0_g1~~TRINITY_DN31606_c0_g1_i1.p1  ORF type:complete len:142 (-),score=8.61 TRINITY_DN31606_c0_g1_i1:33-458(-)